MGTSRHRIRSTVAWPALLATVVLLILLLGGYTLLESRRLQDSLSRDLEERARALVGVLEAASRNALAGNALLEELIAQRLLDNARFIDFLAGRGPWAQELIQRVVKENHLAKAELLDPLGHPISLAPPEIAGGPRGGPVGPGRGEPAGRPGRGMGWMMGMMGQSPTPSGEPGSPPPEGQRPPPPFMWGSRWGGMRRDPAALFPSLPKDAKVRRFWEGSAFGVAVPAQNFQGIVAVHADAEYLLNFRKEIGLQRLIEELGRQGGVAGVALLDAERTVLAASDPAAIGRHDPDPFLEGPWEAGAVKGRHLAGARQGVYQVVTPFRLEKERVGLLRLDLGTEGMTEAVRQAHRSILFYSLGLLLVGVAGAVAIFWSQARHAAERRALEEAVAREQRLAAMGNLAAGVAHEIRNPLNAISVGLQRLKLEFAPAEPEAKTEYAGFVQLLRDQVGRLNTLVDQFLTLARPLKLNMVEEPIAPLLDEAVALLAPQASLRGVRIEGPAAPGALRVRMDRGQLTQALLNVLLNAIQASAQEGVVTIRIEAGGGLIRIAVADTGPGIAPEHLDRLFEPYFTTKPGGTGLGLALSHKIVQEHGGSLRAGNGPGGGAVFTLSLPAAGVGIA
jgi:signal transduction histidine kinase